MRRSTKAASTSGEELPGNRHLAGEVASLFMARVSGSEDLYESPEFRLGFHIGGVQYQDTGDVCHADDFRAGPCRGTDESTDH
jgi:hypothetical protein